MLMSKETLREQLRRGEYTAEPPLTPHERAVLDILIESERAVPNKEIAVRLGMSRGQVSRLRRAVSHKITSLRGGF